MNFRYAPQVKGNIFSKKACFVFGGKNDLPFGFSCLLFVYFCAKLPNGFTPNSRTELRQTPERKYKYLNMSVIYKQRIVDNLLVFMMVLTGTGAYAYRRKDGVYVVPIGCLRN